MATETRVTEQPKEGITVTVRDNATGDEESRVVVNDYIIICAGTCYESGIQVYPKSGTHVITIKGRQP